MSVVEAISAGVGAGASAAALLGASLSLRHRYRVRRQRKLLRDILRRLLKLDIFVSVGAVRLDVRLGEDVAWSGPDVWPRRLTGGLNYLAGVRHEAERIGAELRAIDEADPSVARLSDDAEELCELLRNAATRYIDGTVNTYRAREGRGQTVSATRNEFTPTLDDADRDRHREERDRLTWLFRTCLHRIDPGIAEKYECQWPMRRRTRVIQTELVHGPIPAPIHWHEDLVVAD